MDIRKYKDSDKEKLVEIWYEASVTAQSFIAKEMWELHKDDLRNKYLPNSETWVAEEQGELLGFISLVDYYIGGLFISPSKQGMGIGTELIEKVKSIRDKLTVGVYAKNEKAREFYLKNGFVYQNQEVQQETGEVIINMVAKKE